MRITLIGKAGGNMKNMSYFLSEYGKNMETVRELIRNDTADIRQIIIKSAEELLRLAEAAKYDGILALDWEAEKEEIDGLILGEELRRIVKLITGGTDPDIVESIILKRYVTKDYRGLEGIMMLMYADVCLGIQAGWHPDIIDECIRSLVPKEIENDIEKLFSERDSRIKANSKSDWELLFEQEEYADKDSAAYRDIHLLETCLLNMSDDDIQRFFRDIDCTRISTAMKVMRGDVIRRIYDNLGAAQKLTAYEDYSGSGPLPLKEISEAVREMVQILQRLEKEGAISIPESGR